MQYVSVIQLVVVPLRCTLTTSSMTTSALTNMVGRSAPSVHAAATALRNEGAHCGELYGTAHDAPLVRHMNDEEARLEYQDVPKDIKRAIGGVVRIEKG